MILTPIMKFLIFFLWWLLINVKLQFKMNIEIHKIKCATCNGYSHFFCRMMKTGNHGWLTIRPVRVSSSSLSKKLSRTRYPFVLHPCPKPPTKRQSWPQSGQCQFLWLLVVYSSSLSSRISCRYSFSPSLPFTIF